MSKQQMHRKAAMDPTTGSLSRLPYRDDLEDATQTSHRKDLYIYPGRLRIPGLATIPKSYLLRGEPYIGMKVKAEFRTKNPTNTVLDYYWVPYEK
jgi:hypothetical protein